MNPNHYDFIKKLMIISENGSFHGTTEQIGKKLNLAQQTVSQYLISLEKEGYIKRARVKEGQIIYFLDKLYDEFQAERNIIEFILNKSSDLVINGSVFTGLGEGRYYMSQENYRNGIYSRFGFLPFPGTLNIRIARDQLFKFDILRLKIKDFIPEFESNGRVFGKVYLFSGFIKDVPVGIVIPERTHYNDVIELVSEFKLRDKLGLRDGDIIEIRIKF